MQWVFVSFSSLPDYDPCDVRPHVLHPLVAKQRIQDILDRYPVCVHETRRVRDEALDMGGMIFSDESWVEVLLSGDRRVIVRQDQMDIVVDRLKKRQFGWEAKCPEGFTRIGRFPGVVTYLSRADVRKILAKLEPLADAAACAARRLALHEVLVQAQAKGDEKTEKVLRDAMGLPIPGNA